MFFSPEKILDIVRCKIRFAETWGTALVLLAIRLYVGKIFWQSGLTKVVNIDSAKNLFSIEYIPNWEKNSTKTILGTEVHFPVPGVDFATLSATYGELLFSVLLVIGFAGRLSAFGIFIMALTIELFVYPGTQEHIYWLLTMATVMACGSGKISIDHLIRKKIIKT